MKKVFNFLLVHLIKIWYACWLVMCIYDHDWKLASLAFILILWEVTDYCKEKIHKEYTDWLEADRERWRKKYIDEVMGKKTSAIETIIIGKN